MALIFDPIAREQLNEMRINLGALYVNAIWAQRAFEQEIRNEAALTHWRQSFPAWDRLFGRPAMNVQEPQESNAAVVVLPNGRSEDSKAA
jgi:hypothetical protein